MKSPRLKPEEGAQQKNDVNLASSKTWLQRFGSILLLWAQEKPRNPAKDTDPNLPFRYINFTVYENSEKFTQTTPFFFFIWLLFLRLCLNVDYLFHYFFYFYYFLNYFRLS